MPIRTSTLRPRHHLALALLAASACADDGGGMASASGTETASSSGTTAATTTSLDDTATGTTTGADEQVFVLADGTEVLVDAGGGITLRSGDRRFFGTASGVGPVARRFTTTWEGSLGIWEFSREGEEVFAADAFQQGWPTSASGSPWTRAWPTAAIRSRSTSASRSSGSASLAR